MEKYFDGIDAESLLVKLPILRQICMPISIGPLTDIHSHLIDSEETALLPKVVRLLMLLLINPATSASAERSFSIARRLKTWQRSTMEQVRFIALAILNVHKDVTDKIDLNAVGNNSLPCHTRGKFFCYTCFRFHIALGLLLSFSLIKFLLT